MSEEEVELSGDIPDMNNEVMAQGKDGPWEAGSKKPVEIEVVLQGEVAPPVGAEIALIKDDVKTPWIVKAINVNDEGKKVMTCFRHQTKEKCD